VLCRAKSAGGTPGQRLGTTARALFTHAGDLFLIDDLELDVIGCAREGGARTTAPRANAGNITPMYDSSGFGKTAFIVRGRSTRTAVSESRLNCRELFFRYWLWALPTVGAVAAAGIAAAKLSASSPSALAMPATTARLPCHRKDLRRSEGAVSGPRPRRHAHGVGCKCADARHSLSGTKSAPSAMRHAQRALRK
jgi:hypothetical protein